MVVVWREGSYIDKLRMETRNNLKEFRTIVQEHLSQTRRGANDGFEDREHRVNIILAL
jgi:hypothetical protein